MRSSSPASTNGTASEASSSCSFGSSSSSKEAFAPDQDDVQKYESIMSSLLGEYTHRTTGNGYEDEDRDEGISDGEGGKRAMTKAEKQNAKKKRRKERERAEKLRANGESEVNPPGIASESVDRVYKFRLFSSTPIGPVAIKPTNEEYPLTTNPRLKPMSDETNERIRRIAQQAAIECNNLNFTSNHERWTKKQIPIRQYISSCPISHLSICTTTTSDSSSTSKIIPIIPIRSRSQAKEKKTRRGKRRKSTLSAKRAIPSYYAPPVGLGGKARGYAWGWEGSMEGAREL